MERRRVVNPIIKDAATFITTAAESGGKTTVAEIELMPGGGNQLHFHKTFSETFIPVQGELQLNLGGGKILLLNPGERYTVIPGAPHCFHNPGAKKIIFKIEIVPGHTGFEQFIQILYNLAADGKTDKRGAPKSLLTASVILEMGDTHVTGIQSLLTPLIKFLATKARNKGLDKELIKRYCSEAYLVAERA